MDKKNKRAVGAAVLALASLLAKEGLNAIHPPPFVGVILVGLAIALGWFAVIQIGWFEFLGRKYIQYPGYVVIVVVFVILGLFVRGGKPNGSTDANKVVAAPSIATTVQNNQGPTVVATAPNSPGSNPVAVGTLNGPLIVGRSDPNGDGARNRRIDALLALPSMEMRRLEQEYTLGFVLVAYSGEIDMTRIAPHTDRIEGDWSQCRVYPDDENLMRVELPHPLKFRGCPIGS
jgi:hypothetical protein